MKRAFTLAEVLITLGIIGVVAAITIPTLIQNHQKQVWVNGLKRAISTTGNMFEKMKADEGVDFPQLPIVTEGACHVYDASLETARPANCEDDYGTISVFARIIPKYLNTVKTCHNVDCPRYTSTIIRNNKLIKTQENLPPLNILFEIFSNNGGYLSDLIGFYTNDGMIYYIFPSPQFIGVLVDVNGEKGPNIYGRDLFFYSYAADFQEGGSGQIDGQLQTSHIQSIVNDNWVMNY